MTQPLPIRSTLAAGNLGLYHASDFFLTTGRGALRLDSVIPQALWYFEDEPIAIARAGLPIAGFARGASAIEDVVTWAARQAIGMPLEYPSLVWIAAPEMIRGAMLDANGMRIEANGNAWAFDVVPKIALNRSYYDDTSIDFLAQQPLTVRGTLHEGTFVARTIWPEAFRLDDHALLRQVDATERSIRMLVREAPAGGARSAFAAMTLWEREPGTARQWEGKPVLAAMLNGAQGDDDEAHGGHFAIVTGRVGPDGAIGDWLANNFYTLDAFSEKGIAAAVVPLDNYLADLNSGQAWYRPSYLIVAVLKDERTASRIQGALCRVYNQFYRHQLAYDHATMNCASISIDVLRAIGWSVRSRGPTSRLLAALGLPYFVLRDRSLAKAATTFNYLTEDRTRLFPAAAFEEIGADLLRLARREPARRASAFEASLAQDIEALVFLRVPQLPSSRAWGDSPIVSVEEYTARFPSDPGEAKIIPVPARPFPAALRDPGLQPTRPRRAQRALTLWGLITMIAVPWIVWRWLRQKEPKTK
ncbi:MAG TPA: hypothetical protein VN326_21085 [Casimicrobiaceae bacterium]|nr:hypothetical protein [Casimicrobiaceae bacterium]